MTTFREAARLPVVVTSSAETAGTVQGFVVELPQRQIRSIYLGGKKGSAKFVSWEDISSFGADAVMIAGPEKIREGADELEERTADGSLDILDKRILTEIGDEYGKVDDVEFDAATGRIECFTAADNRIAGDRVVGIGSYAVVIVNLAEDKH